MNETVDVDRAGDSTGVKSPLTLAFRDLGLTDVPTVGGKNASLGEMIGALAPLGVTVPAGFATTAEAFRLHKRKHGLDPRIRELLTDARGEPGGAPSAGPAIRDLILSKPLPLEVSEAICAAYRTLCEEEGVGEVAVAVRSSATAEDLPEASFAGQQDTYLNVRGEEALLAACHACFASLFTDRAIAYRERLGFDHLEVALSVGVQRMVRADLASAGVLFTLDPETGFPDVVVVTGAWGLGESVVQGSVDPDRFMVFKPLLDQEHTRPILESTLGSKAEKVVYGSDGQGVQTVPTSTSERSELTLSPDEVLTLSRWGDVIERHYGTPMDVEWAKDGESGELFIVQARPETVWSRRPPTVVSYRLLEEPEPLVTGHGVGHGIASGTVLVVEDPAEVDDVPEGSVLVAPRTDPDWGPYLKKAAAVVTDHGGSTSHAAIVCRELGVPAVVGTGNGTGLLESGQEVTVSCTEAVGQVLPGIVAFERSEERLEDVPECELPILMNVATPTVALRSWPLPARGIGLARLEFLISEVIGAHPMALLMPDRVTEAESEAIASLIEGYPSGAEYFVSRLSEGIAQIAAAVYPDPAVVRTSDFKTNEYASLLGGSLLERDEENPMIGFRGASRYVSPDYHPAFELECEALRRVREDVGLTNVIPMIPFCRTIAEADEVLSIMEASGLRRGENGLEIYVMCEVPSNVVLAREFAQRFDGFSIGSNDLTQLALGVDRDNASLAAVFDESDEAVTTLIRDVIRDAHAEGRSVGFCGQAPSNDPAYAAFLLEAGIDSVSVDPATLIEVVGRVAEAERSASATIS